MSYLLDEIREAQAEPPADGAFAATVAETATAATDLLPVVLDAFPGLQIAGCRWMPRYTQAAIDVAETGELSHNVQIPQPLLPARGDRCLVVFDELGRPWITVWFPAAWGGP